MDQTSTESPGSGIFHVAIGLEAMERDGGQRWCAVHGRDGELLREFPRSSRVIHHAFSPRW
jgi:hypothetical protein